MGGALTGSVWGKPALVGTGTDFELHWQNQVTDASFYLKYCYGFCCKNMELSCSFHAIDQMALFSCKLG